MRIVADCHNRTFAPPWSRIPGLIRSLNRLDAVIAHNDEVGAAAAAMGVDATRLHVLETRPAQIKAGLRARPGGGNERALQPSVLVPCSFNPDEPVDALLKAAVEAPELRFLVTGNVARARARGFGVDSAPANVEFTGFLSKVDYERLLLGATVILGLTTVEGIQLSVANEAVGAGKAMVLSDTAILRTLFGDAALFTSNDAHAIADACRAAVEEVDRLETRSASLCAKREARWLAQAELLAADIS